MSSTLNTSLTSYTLADIPNLTAADLTDSGSSVTSSLLSRLGSTAEILNREPFIEKQTERRQAIATELLRTVPASSALKSPKSPKSPTSKSSIFEARSALSGRRSNDSQGREGRSQMPDSADDQDRSSDAYCQFCGCVHARAQGPNQGSAVPDDALSFATVGSNGQRIDNGNSFTTTPLKWTRSDGKSDGRNATVVTYAFDDEFSVGGISTDESKSLFEDALETWASYAPLDFIEETDPGAGDRVDIFIESGNIDGPGNTLAFAFFPTVGDIKFDSSESWNTDKFLETAVHEVGHSLGLDHEGDTEAIMNPFFGDRYDNGEAFLFEDDIRGIQSLYGSGQGSITTLNGDSPSVPQPPDDDAQPPSSQNLAVNGSFEDVPLSVGQSGTYSQINGWSIISGRGFQVDRRPDSAGQAADGTAWVELDTLGENATMGQNIDTVTGQRYNVSVDFSDGGRPEETTSVHVFWEGQQIDTLSGGGRGEWRRFNYTLMGSSDRTVSTLAFRAIGNSDNVGGFIDNIVVTAAGESLIDSEGAVPSAGLGASSGSKSNLDPITGEDSSIVVDSSLILPDQTASTWV